MQGHALEKLFIVLKMSFWRCIVTLYSNVWKYYIIISTIGIILIVITIIIIIIIIIYLFI